MSFTEAEQVFAGVSQQGANDLVRAFFQTRPRYLNYGSPSFVAMTTVNATQMPSIAFPGVPGGIQWAVSFSIPTLDFHPDDSGGSSPLGPTSFNQFTLQTEVRLTVGCTRRGDDFPNDYPDDYPGRIPVVPISTSLKVIARGMPQVQYFGPGNGEVRLRVDEVEIVDIEPNSLESVIECLMLMMLRAAVANLVLPFKALSMGAFQLMLLRGPEIEQDQVQLYGDI